MLQGTRKRTTIHMSWSFWEN